MDGMPGVPTVSKEVARPWRDLVNPVVSAFFLAHIVIVLIMLAVLAEWVEGWLLSLVLLSVISTIWVVVVKSHVADLVAKEARRTAPAAQRPAGGPFVRPASLEPDPKESS